MESIKAYIYHSDRRPGTYVYLAERDNFDALSEQTKWSLDPLVFSMELELNAQRTLRKENVNDVMQNLKTKGIHIQMPDDVEALLAKVAKSDP